MDLCLAVTITCPVYARFIIGIVTMFRNMNSINWRLNITVFIATMLLCAGLILVWPFTLGVLFVSVVVCLAHFRTSAASWIAGSLVAGWLTCWAIIYLVFAIWGDAIEKPIRAAD